MERSRGLDGGTLKLIAAALMLTDHVGSILLPEVLALRCIGRLAFPLFAFFIAEGYARTRNFWKYLLRMAVFAVIAEVPFDLTGGSVWDPDRQNVLLTFCIALLALRGLDRAAAMGRRRAVFGRGGGAGGGLCRGAAAAGGLRRLGRSDRGAVLSVQGREIREAVAARGHGGAERRVHRQHEGGGIWRGGAHTGCWRWLALPLIWTYNGEAGVNRPVALGVLCVLSGASAGAGGHTSLDIRRTVMAKNKEEKTNVMRTLEQKKIAYTAKTYPHGEGDPIDGVSVAKGRGAGCGNGI